MNMNIAEILDNAVVNYPDKLMMIDSIRMEEKQKYTYKEAYKRAKEIADYFSNELELENENILLLLPDNSEMILYIFGCAYSNNKFVIGTNVLDNDDRTAQLLVSKIVTSNITAIVNEGNLNESLIDKIYENIDDREIIWISAKDVHGNGRSAPICTSQFDDIAFIQFTSGTSSQPKGVLLSNGNFIHGIERIKERCVIKEDNIMINSLPLSHNLGLITTFSMFIMRSTVVFMDVRELLANPYSWLALITKYRASVIGGINIFFIMALKTIPTEKLLALDLSHIHTTFIGGEEIKTKVLRLFIQKFSSVGFNGKSLFPGYGLTENTLLISTSKPGIGIESLLVDERELRNNKIVISNNGNKELVSNGFVFEDDDVIIVDPDTNVRLAEDELIGEIWISGPAIVQGYINNDSAERERFHWKLAGSKKEYLRTGDIGFFKEGRLYLTGRINDLIIIDGNNYYAHEFDVFIGNQIENVPVGNIACFSENDFDGNERLIIVLGYSSDSYPDKNIVSKVSDEIKNSIYRNYRVPVSKIIFTDNEQILKTSIGKIRRNSIKEKLMSKNLKINYMWKDGIIYESN